MYSPRKCAGILDFESNRWEIDCVESGDYRARYWCLTPGSGRLIEADV
jgi:hypothetical protein